MRKKLICIITFISPSLTLLAQNGSVTIHKEMRLEQRIADYGIVNPQNTSAQIDGYRVQVTFEQSKEAIETAKAKLAKYFPDMETYTIYKAPNFFLKAGDFRTYNDAEKVKSKIEAEFPTSNVIREKINLPKID